ncbi:MAG: hypothetical protein ACLP22_05195, partial [Solirubrobacteraceae bacterium]
MATEQRVATPQRRGERFGQLARAVTPASKLAPLIGLERDRANGARAPAATRESHQRRRGPPTFEFLPHILRMQLAAAVQPRSVRPGCLAARWRMTRLTARRLARRARPVAPPTRVAQPTRR